MLNLSMGYKVTEIEKLHEGYMASSDCSYIANVDADKTADVLYHFIAMHPNEHLFFILELPVNLNREDIISPSVINKGHKDIYYIDGCKGNECAYLVDHFGELLINDGISEFGFGCHESQDEIMIRKYNCITIYSNDLSKYDGFFEMHDINVDGNLLTAWDTFTDKTPGSSEMIKSNGKSVYDLPEELKNWGIYLAETRSCD